jgi:hypothetical protein
MQICSRLLCACCLSIHLIRFWFDGFDRIHCELTWPKSSPQFPAAVMGAVVVCDSLVDIVVAWTAVLWSFKPLRWMICCGSWGWCSCLLGGGRWRRVQRYKRRSGHLVYLLTLVA